MKVHIVTDTNENKRIGVYSTDDGARAAAMNFLKHDSKYTDADWECMAHNAGFDSVEEYQIDILLYSDYDEDLMIKVEAVEVEE